MRAWLSIFLLGVACSDYELTPSEGASGGDNPGALPPVLALDPGAIETVICEAGEAGVTISNLGEGELLVEALSVEGDNWALLDPPELPLSIAPTDAISLLLEAGLGPGTLWITSNDPDRPELGLPLDGVADSPPELEITAPSTGTIFSQGELVQLQARVSDDTTPSNTLSLVWESDADGIIGTQFAQPDGTGSLPWDAADRSDGAHQLWLHVTDECGLTSSTDIQVCQQSGYTADNLDISSWQFEGVARWDETDDWLELTSAGTDQVGAAFQTSETVAADEVEIEFAFYVGDGTGADGFSLTALDSERMAGFLGGTGCGIGYGGDAPCTEGPALPGWSIEVDTYYNEDADPTAEDHVAFTFDGDVDAPAAWAILPEMEDSGWHTMRVSVSGGNVLVSIDELTYIDQTLSGNMSFPAYIGFTAGTGGQTNRHLIDALQVTEYACDE